MRKRGFIVATTILSLLLSGCGGGGSSNQAPVISATSPADQVLFVQAGNQVSFSIAASDPEDTLSYSWTATGGDITKSGSSCGWVAPATPGDHLVTGKVSDGTHVASASWNVIVVETDTVEIAAMDITTPTTWSGNKVYCVSGLVRILAGGSLTIEPGTVIKFASGTGIGLIQAGCFLEAIGTPEKPIIFTSEKDDKYGGDTNEDGASSPRRGDWYSVYASGNSGNGGRLNLQYCSFLYGGQNPYYNDFAVVIETTDSIVADCTFISNEKGLCASESILINNIRNNIFYGNRIPMIISSGVNLDNTNIFHNPQDPSQTNDYNGIWARWTPSSQGDVTWQETEVPFVVDGSISYVSGTFNTLSILDPGSLTLGDGVAMKFGPGCTLWHNDNIINYDGSEVYFTALTDDTVLGDTNNDGSASSPELDYWAGVLGPSGYNEWDSIYYDAHARNTH